MTKLFFSKKFFLFLGGVGLFGLFIFFSYLVHKNTFTSFDFDMTVRLQDHMPRRFDTFFSFLSDIGKVEIVSIILLVLLAIYRKVKTFLVFFLYGLFHLIEIYGKTFVHHLPPPHFMLRTHDVFSFPQFYVQETNSYPSGHAARAFFVTVIVGLMVGHSKKINSTQKVLVYAALACYDMLMVVSRVYLGEHWASDVIGGSILGAAMGLLGVIFVL